MLNSVVCFVIGCLEFAVRLVTGIRVVMEAAVGKRTTELLVEEQEQEGNLHAFSGEPVSVAGTLAFEQAVALEFAQIVAELVQTVSIGRELEGGEDGFMDLSGAPAADCIAAMQENFH